LREEISKRNYEYFALDKSEVSEAVRDSLKKELIELEKEFPELITLDSPTQRVGSVLSEKFEKIKHKSKKWSLQDAFSAQELKDFNERILKLVFGEDVNFICELKIDGLNITVWYEKGIFVKALTRGDGEFGEDITHTVKTVEAVPLKLNEDCDLEISGEVYISKKVFAKINQERENQQEELFANPRNAAAGSVRQLDPQVAANRNLEIFFYQVGETNSELLTQTKTQYELLQNFKKLGLRVNPYFKFCKNIEEVIDFCESWHEKRKNLDYEIDGIVVKVNDFDRKNRMGYTAKAPRSAIAYKFPAQQAVSKIEDILIQVGRTGALTPVAVLTPVFLAGSKVSRATLHNEDEIIRKEVRIGDSVIVQKAGDVIPEVVEVLKNLRTGDEKIFEFPKKCPICEFAVLKPEGEAITRCTNSSCFAKKRESLIHFVSKGAMNIDGLGEKAVDALMNAGFVKDPADFYTLTEDDLLTLPLFKEKRTQNLFNNIQKSKIVDLDRFLFGLGIRHLGTQMAEEVAKYSDSWFARLPALSNSDRNDICVGQVIRGSKKRIMKKQLSLFEENEVNEEDKILKSDQKYITPLNLLTIFQNLAKEDLENVEGIGEKVAESLKNWFIDVKNQNLLEKFTKVGLQLILPEEKKQLNTFFAQKSFLITGTLKSMSRDEAKKKIKNLGGKILSSVSKNLDYLIVGESLGNKLKKAEECSVKILNEEEFLEFL